MTVFDHESAVNADPMASFGVWRAVHDPADEMDTADAISSWEKFGHWQEVMDL